MYKHTATGQLILFPAFIESIYGFIGDFHSNDKI